MRDILKCPRCGGKVVVGVHRHSDQITLKCMKLRMGCEYFRQSTEKEVEAVGGDLKRLEPPIGRPEA